MGRIGLFLLVCCALTYRIMFPPRSARDGALTRQLLPIQIALLLLLVALTGWTIALQAHALTSAPPLWQSFHRHLALWIGAITPRALGPAFVSFAELAILPLVVLAVLRVPLTKMGLGGFTPGSGGAAAIWLLLPMLAIAYLILYADTSAALVGQRLIYSFFASGFSQEFLFRGALFGIWHFGSDVAHGHGIVTALALIVPAQASFGFAMAILVRRTGNLAIPALLHTAIDAIRAIA